MCGHRGRGARRTGVASRRRRGAGELGLGGVGRRGVPGRERRRSSAVRELGSRVPEREAGGGCSPRRRREVSREAGGAGRPPRSRVRGSGRVSAPAPSGAARQRREGEAREGAFFNGNAERLQRRVGARTREVPGAVREGEARCQGGRRGEMLGGGEPRPGGPAGPVSAPGAGGEGHRAPRADGKELRRAGRWGRAGRAAVGAGSRRPDRGGAELGSPLT